MLLTKIILNDFGVYRGRNEFDVQTTKDKPIILIGGTNGAGKTTLFESVMLCLYGQNSFDTKITQKQYHAKILRLIHRILGTKKAADSASLGVEFQYAHAGKVLEYKVFRMWQNNDGSIDEEFTIEKRMLGDEKFVRLDSLEESEWQTFIDQLLPKGITKLFFFDGEKIQNIADSGNEDKFIRSSFDTLLGLDLVKQLIDDIGISVLRNSDGDTKKILEEIEYKTKEKQMCESKVEKLQYKQSELNMQKTNLEKELAVHEQQFKKLGGQFADKRDSLTVDKTKYESKLENVEKEIRDMCIDVLPFSLIPKQMDELKNEIELDKQKIKTNHEKDILNNNFRELEAQIESDSFLSKYDTKTRASISAEIKTLFAEKLNSISESQELSYNFSEQDMDKVTNLIDSVNDESLSKLESLAKSHNVLANSLSLTAVGLESAPKDDQIGPIFSELTKTSRELGELVNQIEHLENLEAQEKSVLILLNSQIRINLTKKQIDKKRLAGLELGPKVQEVLEDYSNILRNKKLELLERYILDGLTTLLHKTNFIEKVKINKETFEIKLFKGNDDEISKDMLSKGELQMYSTSIVRALAKTSGRPLPFMIDTPLARLDEDHRKSLVGEFYPTASHQTIILSTDSEINYEHYKELKPYIAKSIVIAYDSENGKTVLHDRYFFNSKGEKEIEV
ncbi:MAG: DNA sulfur modification protein DndD [Candidatus Nitrosopelagicus sp.]|nr:DNA sulfur modification protein DndD [Candidatus Nitrosopelagicus sp.]